MEHLEHLAFEKKRSMCPYAIQDLVQSLGSNQGVLLVPTLDSIKEMDESDAVYILRHCPYSCFFGASDEQIRLKFNSFEDMQ